MDSGGGVYQAYVRRWAGSKKSACVQEGGRGQVLADVCVRNGWSLSGNKTGVVFRCPKTKNKPFVRNQVLR